MYTNNSQLPDIERVLLLGVTKDNTNNESKNKIASKNIKENSSYSISASPKIKDSLATLYPAPDIIKANAVNHYQEKKNSNNKNITKGAGSNNNYDKIYKTNIIQAKIQNEEGFYNDKKRTNTICNSRIKT